MQNQTPNRLRQFVQTLTAALPAGAERATYPDALVPALKRLVAHDDWLADDFARPGADTYRQYLLYCDPLERFSVVSFVWAAGQKTPIHDHTVWGAIGQLRGTEVSTPYVRGDNDLLHPQTKQTATAGDVIAFTPAGSDIHQVVNPGPETAVSIHVYGANIGRVTRSIFDAASGAASPFISGYSSDVIPNIWSE